MLFLVSTSSLQIYAVDMGGVDDKHIRQTLAPQGETYAGNMAEPRRENPTHTNKRMSQR